MWKKFCLVSSQQKAVRFLKVRNYFIVWLVFICFTNIATENDTSILNLKPEVKNLNSVLGEQSVRQTQ